MKWQFWRWLFRGLNDRPGIVLLANRWLLLHLIIAVGVALMVEVPVKEAAQTLILPLAGIFIGLSFAWAGNAQALLQDAAVEKLTEKHPDGIRSYVYTFQLAILIILMTLVLWGLAGLGIFELDDKYKTWKFLIEATLYLFASFTIQECWSVVLGSQLLILSRNVIKKADKTQRP